VNISERVALSQSAALFDEISATIDERTSKILDRRNKTSVVHHRGWLVRRMLLLADVVGLMTAFLCAELLLGDSRALHIPVEFLIFVLTLPGWIVVAKIYRLYENDEERANHSTTDDVVAVFHVLTVGVWLFFLFARYTLLVAPDLPKLALFWSLGVLAVSFARVGARAICRRTITYQQNTIIVGAGDVGRLVARKVLQHPEYGINLVGFVDSHPKEAADESVALLGSTDRLPTLVRVLDVERVILAYSNSTHHEELELIRSLKDMNVQVDVVPRLFELLGASASFHTIEAIPLVGLAPPHLARSSKLLKRAFDLVLGSTILVALAPLLLLIAAAVRFDSPGPVLFRQVRMGRRERTFRIFKFRTMVVDAEEQKDLVAHLNQHLRPGGDPRMFKVPDDPRTTRVGQFLRRYSLDELPQLFNVLKGEMSLVGPRPLILDEDKHVKAWQRRRLRLKPGMTGPWQVLGASDIPFDEMVKVDYLYATSWSLFTDLKLVLKTLPALVRVRTAY
jgi:exopolysaccharide biosynthesis polyprenyl glycosylphosphotransferase